MLMDSMSLRYVIAEALITILLLLFVMAFVPIRCT